jgi:hypothetical protein
MIGSRQFRFIDMRLREIFAINKPFGGVSVIVVGDLNQLQPVLDDWIFKPNKNNLADLLGYNHTITPTKKWVLGMGLSHIPIPKPK